MEFSTKYAGSIAQQEKQNPNYQGLNIRAVPINHDLLNVKIPSGFDVVADDVKQL